MRVRKIDIELKEVVRESEGGKKKIKEVEKERRGSI